MRIERVDPTDATVLFGAGVTRASGGPTAFELVEAIARHLVEDEPTRRWIVSNVQPAGDLRFETAMDELAGVADPDLDVLDLFGRLEPGNLHATLAWASSAGARLITVNFDDLGERAMTIPAWTVDLQEKLNLPRLDDRGAVVKLHGTQRVHRGDGGVDERGSRRLQATIASIVASGGGAGLRPDVEDHLRSLVDRRVLVVVGYSGSDDLDVMPSLERCAPTRVVWVQHGGDEPRPGSAEALTAGATGLVRAWERTGVSVQVVVGPTAAVLDELTWHPGEGEGDDQVESHQHSWQEHVRAWAAQAREHDPAGMAWAGELQASLGRFDLAQRSLERSRPSSSPGGLWTDARRRFALAENAYQRDVAYDDVRRLAKAAAAAADAAGDFENAARALHLTARTHRVDDPPDLSAAREALDRAESRLEAVDAPGVTADILLERARLELFAENDDAAAALAARAADRYRSAGHYQQLSEGLQVRAHALALDGEHEQALEVLEVAVRIARNGPYPERQIAADATAAVVADDMGRVEDVVLHAEAAIDVAERTQHTAEVAQMYAYLGLARSEQGRFADAATAFRRGLAAPMQSTRTMRPILVCGLAASLLQLGELDEAQRLVDEHRDALEASAGHALLTQLLGWSLAERRGEPAGWDDRLVEEAPFNGEVAFALAQLAPPTAAVRSYLDRVREHLVEVEQHDRVSRLDAARSRSPTAPT